jgi:hypothetical protein
MGIKDIFTKNKLKPYISFSQKGNIWRLYFSNEDIIFCETRDMNSKEVFFASINYKTKQIYLSNFQLTEKWWISVEGITDKTVYFNRFKTPELPEHLGIISVDAKTGKIKWENEDLTFLFAEANDVYAYREQFEREIFYKLNADDGSIEETYEDEKIADSLLELKKFNEERIFTGFLYPVIYVKGNEVTPQIENYLHEKFKDVNYQGEIEYLDYGNLLIYNFHEDRGINPKDLTVHNLINKLEIFDFDTKKIIHTEILNTDSVNYVPDSFFMKDGFLFYIREKKELISIDLSF